MLTESAAPWLRGFDSDLVNAVRSMPMKALRDWLSTQAQHRCLVTGHGKSLRFVAQEDLPTQAAYESWIAQTGCVPTRDNLHDRYNAMVWLSAPKTKARLNALQAEAIAAQTSKRMRGGLRDAATIWDENLAVIVASCDSVSLTDALHRHDWNWIFQDMRHHWGRTWQIMPFGHALLEKLERPFKSITAHVLVVPMRPDSKAQPVNAQAMVRWPWLDEQLLHGLSEAMATSAFAHLPMLGIPGWDPANADPAFYDDASVFRPARMAAASSTSCSS